MSRYFHDQKVHDSRSAIIRWLQFDRFVPERAVTSYWASSKLFLAIRLLLALYTAIVFWTYLALIAVYADVRFLFSEFTTFTFIGLHAYIVTSCVHHFRYLYNNNNIDFMLNQPSVLNYLYLYLYSTVITYNILTPVVFWSILSSSKYTQGVLPVVMWINVSIHGVSFFIMIIDVILNRIKVPVRMVVPVFLTVVVYMLLTFVIYGSTDEWVYPFLNWDQGPRTALWYFVVAIIVVVAFFVMLLIHWFRDFVARKTGRAEVGAYNEKSEADSTATSPRQGVEIHHDSSGTKMQATNTATTTSQPLASPA